MLSPEPRKREHLSNIYNWVAMNNCLPASSLRKSILTYVFYGFIFQIGMPKWNIFRTKCLDPDEAVVPE